MSGTITIRGGWKQGWPHLSRAKKKKAASHVYGTFQVAVNYMSSADFAPISLAH